MMNIGRTLSSAAETDNVLLKEVSGITIVEVQERIIDMHKNIKICINDEFGKNPSDVLDFSQIVKLCVGENYSILLRFYEEIVFILKEITKEKIKEKMDVNFCDDVLF